MVASIYSFASDEVRMKWREPFFTAGVNAALAVVQAPGIYRGFRLLPTVTNCELLVRADETAHDSVAVYLTASGLALTLRRTSDLTLDLTAYAGSTLYVTIYAVYSLGSPTTATIRLYTASEYLAAAERSELLVLGMVTVTSSAPVATVLDHRTVAARSLASGVVPPRVLLRNGGFETGAVGDAGALTLPYWEKVSVSGTASWRTRSTVHSADSLKSLALAYVSGAPYSGYITQAINAPVTPGQVVRLSYKVRVDAVPLSGSLAITFDYTAGLGGSTGTVTAAVALGATTAGAFVSVDLARVVPIEVTHLRSVTIAATLLSYGSSADVLFLDDLVVSLLEAAPEAEPPLASSLTGYLSAGVLALEDPTIDSYGPASILRHLDAAYDGDPGVVASGRDGGPTLLNLLGRLIVGDGIQSEETTPRLKMDFDVASTATLMWESVGGAEGAIRMYAYSNGAFILTVNARWDGTHWTRDVTTTYGSTALQLASYGLFLYDHNAALADTWNDSYTTGHWEATFTTPVPASTFAATLATGLTVGQTIANTNAGAILPRLVADRSTTPARSLILEMGPTGHGVRIYRSYSGAAESFEVVHNATWNAASAEWTRESGSVTSQKFAFGPTGLDVWTTTQTTWSDAAWETAALRVSTTPNPASNATPVVNSLHATQVAKAWGRITTDGVGGLTVTSGFNISTALFATTSIYVTLARPMANALYAIDANGVPPDISTWVDAKGLPADASHFSISYFELSTGVPTVKDLRATAATVTFVVFGNQ